MDREEIMMKAFSDELVEQKEKSAKAFMADLRKEFAKRLDAIEHSINTGTSNRTTITPPAINVESAKVHVDNHVNPTPIENKNYIEQAKVYVDNQVNPTPIEVKNLVPQPKVEVKVSPTPITVNAPSVKNTINVKPTPVQVNNEVNVSPTPIKMNAAEVVVEVDMKPFASILTAMDKRMGAMEDLLEELVNRRRTFVIDHGDGVRATISEE